jgi:phosphate acetyltransferase
MAWIERFCERARPLRRRIVLPEAEDEAVVRAAVRLAADGIARPLLMWQPDDVAATVGDLALDGIDIVDPTNPDLTASFAATYASRRGLDPGLALRLMRRPLFLGAMMVATGRVDAMVAGASHSTAQVITAASLGVGFAEGVKRASSFFVMVLAGPPERVLVYADSAVVVEPDADELAHIAVLTARNAAALLQIEPRVAMLSYSTHGSARHERVDKVRAAVELARKLAPDLVYRR